MEQSAVDRNTAAALVEMGDLVLHFGLQTEPAMGRGAEDRGSGGPRSATQTALNLYTRSLAICEALAKADPGSDYAKRELSASYQRIGDVHLQLGATSKALEAYHKIRELSEALAKADPNDADAKRDLSIASSRLTSGMATPRL